MVGPCVKNNHVRLNKRDCLYFRDCFAHRGTFLNLVFTYHYQAEKSGYTFNSDKIQIKQQEGFEWNYDYKVDVSFEKDGDKKEGGEQKTSIVKGVATINDGPVGKLGILDDGGLKEDLQSKMKMNRQAIIPRSSFMLSFTNTLEFLFCQP